MNTLVIYNGQLYGEYDIHEIFKSHASVASYMNDHQIPEGCYIRIKESFPLDIWHMLRLGFIELVPDSQVPPECKAIALLYGY